MRSQNGWVALSSTGLRARYLAYWRVAGVLLSSRRGDVQTVFEWVTARYAAEVHPLHQAAGQWGFAFRMIRGSSSFVSNHASATAIDYDAALHPLGTSPGANFTSRQIASIHRIIRDSRGCLRWGGDYSGRKDGMHIEVVGSRAEIAALAKRIRAGHVAGHTPKEHDVQPIHTSLSKTTRQTIEWSDASHTRWSVITWNRENADPAKSHKPGNYPGYYAPLSTWVEVGLEELALVGLRPGDWVQVCVRVHDVGRSGKLGRLWQGILHDGAASAGVHHLGGLTKRKGVRKHQRITVAVAVWPEGRTEGRDRPVIRDGRITFTQER